MAGLFRVYTRRPFLFTTPTPVSSSICHISDHWHSRLLRTLRQRPRGRAAEQRNELAPLHSITSSASSRRRARERSAARLARARGSDFSVCAMLLLIAAIGTTPDGLR